MKSVGHVICLQVQSWRALVQGFRISGFLASGRVRVEDFRGLGV